MLFIIISPFIFIPSVWFSSACVSNFLEYKFNSKVQSIQPLSHSFVYLLSNHVFTNYCYHKLLVLMEISHCGNIISVAYFFDLDIPCEIVCFQIYRKQYYCDEHCFFVSYFKVVYLVVKTSCYMLIALTIQKKKLVRKGNSYENNIALIKGC